MDFKCLYRTEEQKGFVVLPKRWLVERTFGWFNWCRRLSKDYEILPETTETFVYIAMIRLMRETSCVIINTYQKLFRHPLSFNAYSKKNSPFFRLVNRRNSRYVVTRTSSPQ
ncbi:transposase (plasmid) [Scytonema sp. HK-05]|nr:transposase [Scytonema sp. HK-05]